MSDHRPGRRVLVTGAASGLGHGIAAAFAEGGDQILLADRDPSIEDVARQLGATAYQLDIGEPDQVAATAEQIRRRHGGLDVLVNNAGVVGGGGSLHDVPIEVFDQAFRVNVRGTFLMLRTFGPLLGAGGAIVNVSSIGARQPTAGLGHYEATKAAIEALTRTAAIELAGRGVRVNAVAPGPVLTPLTADLVADHAARSAWESRIPLKSIARIEQVAPLVVFLCSTAASHITGTSVPVDGGQLLT